MRLKPLIQVSSQTRDAIHLQNAIGGLAGRLDGKLLVGLTKVLASATGSAVLLLEPLKRPNHRADRLSSMLAGTSAERGSNSRSAEVGLVLQVLFPMRPRRADSCPKANSTCRCERPETSRRIDRLAVARGDSRSLTDIGRTAVLMITAPPMASRP